MIIPVAIITDSDVREYEKQLQLDNDGKPVKDAKGKNQYEFIKIDEETIKNESENAIKKISEQGKQNVKCFPALNWTLEYSLFKSPSLTKAFQAATNKIHSDSPWENDFEKELAKKLINKSFEKTKIAYEMANAIDEDLEKYAKKEIEVNAFDNGSVHTDGKTFLKFACSDGFIHVTDMQLEGKKRMNVEDFLRGWRM